MSLPYPIAQERVLMPVAMAITGKRARVLQEMALKGLIPGAAKLGGQWTFDEAGLRKWVKGRETQPCQDVKPRKVVSGAVKRSGVARRLKVETTNSPYELAIQKLRGRAAQQKQKG